MQAKTTRCKPRPKSCRRDHRTKGTHPFTVAGTGTGTGTSWSKAKDFILGALTEVERLSESPSNKPSCNPGKSPYLLATKKQSMIHR